MKKITLLVLAFCLSTALFGSVSALRWQENMSRRVATMGGATFGIEDETTALTPFNHQNIAGVALNAKENRIDIGLGYLTTFDKTETTTGTTVNTNEVSTTTLELARPGAEYRGVTYWIGDNTVIRAGIEGLSMSMQVDDTTKTPSTTTLADDSFSAIGIGGGASISHKLDMGLALGAGLSYKYAGGKPGDLLGAFDVYGGEQTTKLELAMTNLDWSVGAAYEMLQLGGDNNKLTFGVNAHSDDDMPQLNWVIAGVVQPNTIGDYNLVREAAGTVGSLELTDTYTFSTTPLVLSAEAIFNMGTVLEAGLLIDYKMSSMNTKLEQTGYPVNSSLDYKNADMTTVGITPVVQGKLPINEETNILAGIMYTSWGSGKVDNYSLDTSTADVNDTFKSNVDELTSTFISVGGGLQAMKQQLQVAVQYEMLNLDMDDTNYNVNGTIVQQLNKGGIPVDTTTTTIGQSNIRMGAEFWVQPSVAIRAGYAILTQTTEDGFYNTTSAAWEDLKQTTGSLTFGGGVKLNQANIDLMIKIDTISTDPEATGVTTEEQDLSVLLSTKIMI